MGSFADALTPERFGEVVESMMVMLRRRAPFVMPTADKPQQAEIVHLPGMAILMLTSNRDPNEALQAALHCLEALYGEDATNKFRFARQRVDAQPPTSDN